MAHCIEKLPHKCGSKDALQVFEDNGKLTGYCFSCKTYVPNPYGEERHVVKQKIKKTNEEISEELNEIRLLRTVEIPSRSLKQSSLEYFNVRVALWEEDGKTPTVRYFPFTKNGEVIAYKAKLVPEKKMWCVGHMKDVTELFGWQQALTSGARKLFVTEGEDDAVALYQAIKEHQIGTQWAKYNPAVVSLTAGTSSAKRNFVDNLQLIRANFKEVILVFDMDEAGNEARRDVLQIYPTAHTVTLPEKDANDCIIKGHSKALAAACLFKTDVPKNTRVISGSSVYEAGRKQAAYGLSYPWVGLTKLTRGMRFGETYYLGAGVKMGKSTMRSALAAHLITTHGLKVFMAAPEETNKKSYQLIASQCVGKIFHDPDVKFDYEAYDRARDIIGDNLYLLNLYQHLDWSALRADIMVAANEGCKAIFVDPITNLTNGIASGEANTALQEIAQDLAAIALDLNLIIWMFCHLKAPESGDSHERGGKVLSHQFAGSRAMMRSCNMMIGLEGNKDPDFPELIRCQRRLVVLEDREFGASGIVPLFYNIETGLYSEIKKDKNE